MAFAHSELTGHLDDLDLAIDVSRLAADSLPEGHPQRPLFLSNLGASLRHRFESDGQNEDLNEAVDVGHRAVALSSEDHPQRSLCLTNLAVALQMRFEQTGRTKDLDAAIGMFHNAADVGTSPILMRANAALQWGRAAEMAQKWAEAAEGYGVAVKLAGLVASPELGRTDQEFRHTYLAGVGRVAAAACLEAGQTARAVEMFEHGRAMLFSRQLDARSDLTDLEQVHPELAMRFVQARDELDLPAPHLSKLSSGGSDRRAAARRQKAAAEFDQVLEKIQTLPGFERFLSPLPLKELLPAAADGPIVLLNIAPLRSDALILTKAGVEVLPLEGIDPDSVSKQVNAFLAAVEMAFDPLEGTSSEPALAGVLEWLWHQVTGPVLNHLGFTTPPAEGTVWPRVWWCPSGALSLLPLHAAGRNNVLDGSPDAVIDRVISSTIPTVRALLRARKTQPPVGEQRMLVVAMPHTPDQAPLPGVFREANTLLRIYAGNVDVLGLPGSSPATYETVTGALSGHALAHFSCHGISDPNDPSASQLLLADYQTRPLTVLDLARSRLQGAELAFLSACTTARTGVDLLDEPIHLSAACQLAGYRHVIASLWPIDDDATAELTNDFYTLLATTPVPYDAAAEALHLATRQLRSTHHAHPSRWAPYLHTGP